MTEGVSDRPCARGTLLHTGKTKLVYDHLSESDHDFHVDLVYNDNLTAHDGRRKDSLPGKGAVCNSINAKIFQFLAKLGIPVAWKHKIDESSFCAQKCAMIPIEWVVRRIATGSFLRRNAGVPEGHRFVPPKMETFFKDDEQSDPIWSREQILCKKFSLGGLEIGRTEYDCMADMTVTVFEILERAWAAQNCSLVDLKVEFGVDLESRKILLADVIDCDSWRLWPNGEKALAKDKQVFRDTENADQETLQLLLRNYTWVDQQLKLFVPPKPALVVILMASAKDIDHSNKIMEYCKALGMAVAMRCASAHKSPEQVLNIIGEYEVMENVVLIAVAGRSNGLGPLVSGNASLPVINCPVLPNEGDHIDIWSSLRIPGGLGCCTVLYPEAAAQHAASILAVGNFYLWCTLRARRLYQRLVLAKSDVAAMECS